MNTTRALPLKTRVQLATLANKTSDLSQSLRALASAKTERERRYWSLFVDCATAEVRRLESELPR